MVTVCDHCGYATGLVQLRVLWLPVDGQPPKAQGSGSYVFCRDCTSRVVDAIVKPIQTRTA